MHYLPKPKYAILSSVNLSYGQGRLVRFKLKKGLILTYDEEEEFKMKNKKIKVRPVWKWLLEDKSNSFSFRESILKKKRYNFL